jgi:hypothetical protein
MNIAFLAILCCSAAALNIGGKKKCAIDQVPYGYYFGTDGHMAVQIKVFSPTRMALEYFVRDGKIFVSHTDLEFSLKDKTCEISLGTKSSGFIYTTDSGKLERFNDTGKEWGFRLKYSDGGIVLKNRDGRLRIHVGPTKLAAADWAKILENFGFTVSRSLAKLLAGSCPSQSPRLGWYTGCNTQAGVCMQMHVSNDGFVTLDFAIASSEEGVRLEKIPYEFSPLECMLRLVGKSIPRAILARLQPKGGKVAQFLEGEAKRSQHFVDGVFTKKMIMVMGTALVWDEKPVEFSQRDE